MRFISNAEPSVDNSNHGRYQFIPRRNFRKTGIDPSRHRNLRHSLHHLLFILTSTVVAIVLTGGALGRLSIKWTKLSLASYAKGGSLVEEIFSSIRNTLAAGTQDRFAKSYDKHLDEAETLPFERKRQLLLPSDS